MKKDALEQLCEDLKSYAIPKPIRVLVKQSSSGQKGYTALLTQYSLHAQDTSKRKAVMGLLYNLANYLASCERDDVHPLVYASDIYLEAFDYGTPLEIEDLDDLVDVRAGTLEIRQAPENLE